MQETLKIHRVHTPPASLEEVDDRHLMDLIREAKAAHEHLVVASMAMIAHRKKSLQLLMFVFGTSTYHCLITMRMSSL